MINAFSAFFKTLKEFKTPPYNQTLQRFTTLLNHACCKLVLSFSKHKKTCHLMSLNQACVKLK